MKEFLGSVVMSVYNEKVDNLHTKRIRNSLFKIAKTIREDSFIKS
jgi:hypothetical protein